MNFPLSTDFIASYRFRYTVPSFSLNSRMYVCMYVFIYLFIYSLTQKWFNSSLFNIHEFVGFLWVVLLLNSNFKLWWSCNIQEIIPFFSICWGFICYWVCGQFLKRFHEVLRRMYILLCLGGMFWRCMLSLFESSHLLVLLFL